MGLVKCSDIYGLNWSNANFKKKIIFDIVTVTFLRLLLCISSKIVPSLQSFQISLYIFDA